MDKTKCVNCICTDCVRNCDKCDTCNGTHKMGECYGYTEEFLICEGCGGKIFVGDDSINIDLDEEIQHLTIHKNLDCLLKLDGVTWGTITEIKTVNPYESTLKRIK